ncbi:hypothetical protein SBC1_26980 [Caballeronia sp. SBC1]|uniref:hypothetical protein n=1 Tax=Caballeronia sp. SBC1 TaxID=2705548 RepID=UPI0014082A6C|nr:hypothetical protein [Caballeronia sp. SBC1]QIN62682.1 hypothetical protein SBC1_26980 [Caballeronia sp. SBC1]
MLVNEDCHNSHRGDVWGVAVRTVRTFIRLVAWMFRCGRYKLEQVEPKLLEKLAKELAKKGWWGVLDYSGRLNALIERAQRDGDFARSLEGALQTRFFHLNIDFIRSQVHLPIESVFIPRNIVTQIFKASGSAKKLERATQAPHVTQNSLYVSLKFLNRCALVPGFDSFKTRPFPAPLARAKSLLGKEDKRTENLSIDDVVTIFSEALKWTYVRADGVIQLCEVARAHLESDHLKSVHPNVARRTITRRVHEKYKEIARTFDLPEGLPSLVKEEGFSLRTLILQLQISCAISVLFNHGRRREEVIGFGKSYGLYRGCLTAAEGQDSGSYLDIYVEKTLQCYVTMWANEVVERAVDVLERLGQVFRPLGAPLLESASDVRSARKDKLFVFRNFTYASFEGKASEWAFDRVAKFFFSKLNVSVKKSTASHIYRRCFALIYMYRHDHPILMALSRHLCHITLETTRVYTEDAKDTEDGRSVESLFPLVDLEDAAFDSILEEERSEYFEKKILQILSGESVGGHFSRIVARIARSLESRASFKEASMEERARQTREVAEEEGYSPVPKANTTCAAGCANKTKRQANCYSPNESRVCPEKASAELCAGCIHAITTPSHRSAVELEIASLMAAAGDTRRPLKLQLAARDAADGLRAVLDSELKTATEMQKFVGRLVDTWKPIMFQEKTYA